MTVTHKIGLKVYIDFESNDQLQVFAEADDRPVTYLVRQAITEYLTRRTSNGVAANPAGAAATPSDSGG